jgi:type I restriction enzyme R subunit
MSCASGAYGSLHKVFGADARIVREAADGSNDARNARIHIASYQSLGIHQKATPPSCAATTRQNHFSHIIIDECHRSAWGTWSEVLTRNSDAFRSA